MIVTLDPFELDDDPRRVDRDAVWRYLSTQAYWGLAQPGAGRDADRRRVAGRRRL